MLFFVPLIERERERKPTDSRLREDVVNASRILRSKRLDAYLLSPPAKYIKQIEIPLKTQLL